MQSKVIIGFGVSAALIFVLGFALLLGTFRYTSICDKCGAESDTTDWQVPLTSLTVFSSSTVTETRLSRVLRENGIVPDHRHNWIFAGGSGNFMLCAIGRGRHLVSATKSEEFASLVLLLHENQQTEFRDRIVTGVFDPYRSHIFHSVSYLNPPGKLSGTELQQWVDEQSEYLDAELAAYE